VDVDVEGERMKKKKEDIDFEVMSYELGVGKNVKWG
jgi:hypothetical protein